MSQPRWGEPAQEGRAASQASQASQASHDAMRTPPSVYRHAWPAWRLAPTFRPHAFQRWLEERCDQEGWTAGQLARAVWQALPPGRASTVVYQNVFAWFRRGNLPAGEYLCALAAALNTPLDRLIALEQVVERERAQQPARRPGRPRRSPLPETPSTAAPRLPALLPPVPLPLDDDALLPPRQTTTEVRAALLESVKRDLLRQIEAMPEFDAALRQAVAQRLAAQTQQLAQRVGTAGLPAVPVVPSGALEQEALEQEAQETAEEVSRGAQR